MAAVFWNLANAASDKQKLYTYTYVSTFNNLLHWYPLLLRTEVKNWDLEAIYNIKWKVILLYISKL